MLFKDSTLLKTYAQLTGEFNFDSVKATVRKVEDDYILPVTGPELYEALNTAYTDAASEASLTDPQKALLEKCRLVIGPFVCVHFAPKADVQLGDGGVRRTETTNVKTAFQYQTNAFIEENRSEGESAQEKLIRFLEAKAGDYPLWKESADFKKYRSYFIKTGDEFNEYFPSSSPYRNYWAMRSKMGAVEQLTVKKLLGKELFDGLKTKDGAAQNFTDEEKQLLIYLKYAIASFTVALAVPFISVRIDTYGITVMNTTFTSNDELSKRSAADGKSIDHLINSCNSSAKQWMAEAEAYIRSNPTAFTTWPGFSNTTSITSLNEGRSGVFGA